MNLESPRVHFATKVVSALRDNLAQHDKPISFLFGAGTSCSIKISDSTESEKETFLIPAVHELTADCKENAKKKDPKFEKAWSVLEKECESTGQVANIENILSRLRMIIQVIGDDSLLGLNKSEIESFEKCIRKNIAKRVSPDLKILPNNYPHRKFSKWLMKSSRKRPVEIFTLNYDLLIEHALECEQISFFDGFIGSYQPFFNAESLQRIDSAPGQNWSRLWKMHGSVNWSRINLNGNHRIIRGFPVEEGEMIYPSHQKYDESRQQPYSAFADRLRRFLDLDDSLLVVCGYSFGDEHINQIIFGALENKPRTHVYALQYGNLVEGDVLYNYAIKLKNLIVIGRSSGVIGCQHAVWEPINPPPHLTNILEFSQDNFNFSEQCNETTPAKLEKSSNKDSGNETTGEKTNEQFHKNDSQKSLLMKIGDFSTFCDFLDDMTANELKEG